MRDERGASAVEFGLVAGLLVLLIALTGPLAAALAEQLKLGRTAGRTVRFATEAPDRKRYDCFGNRVARRPTAAEVVAEALCTHYGTGAPAPSFTVSVNPEPRAAAPGQPVEVAVSNVVDLGPIGDLLGKPELTLTARAVSLRE
jgi:Flp pilus assembly protein TadG